MNMKVITANLNGVRSAASKGFFTWALRQRADVICVQETKAQEWQLTDPVFHPKSLHTYYHDAQKKGYSGTALFCRDEPDEVVRGMGIDWIDNEGRYLEARFNNVTIVSLYMPSGSSGDERQGFKIRMMDSFLPHLKKIASQRQACADLWGLEYCSHERRYQKLARQPEKFGLPARRATVA